MVTLKKDKKNDIHIAWLCNKWVSFNFFDDVIASSEINTELTKEIKYLNDFGFDTLNLMRFPDAIEEFKIIIENVIQYNKETQGSDMHDPSYFQVYFDKLLELKKMFYETYGFSDEE